MMREEMDGKRLYADEMDARPDAALMVQLRRWRALARAVYIFFNPLYRMEQLT